jgi:hypothetical protein
LLKSKERKFIEYIKEASEFYNMEFIPQVIFFDDFIPENPNVLADIDIVSKTIRVSRKHLIEMPIEKIKETAFHETTHIFEPSHNTFFKNKLDDSLVTTWKPESTVGIRINDGYHRDVKLDGYDDSQEIENTICDYHLCRKKTKLYRCSHCGKYYCEEHIKPIPPSMPDFDYPNKFIEWKEQDNRHPCPIYYDYLRKQEKERHEKYSKSLDKLNNYVPSYESFLSNSEIILNEIESGEKNVKNHKFVRTDDENNFSNNPESLNEKVRCYRCGRIINGEIKYGNGFDIYTKEDIPLCSECYDKEKNTPKKELKWKITVGILTLIACGILILAISSIMGIL